MSYKRQGDRMKPPQSVDESGCLSASPLARNFLI
jgi:hypothetical protein